MHRRRRAVGTVLTVLLVELLGVGTGCSSIAPSPSGRLFGDQPREVDDARAEGIEGSADARDALDARADLDAPRDGDAQ